MSAFDTYRKDAWPIHFTGRLSIANIHGGTPSNEKVAEGWLRSKLADKDDLIRAMVAETMIDRGVNADAAATLVDAEMHVHGFKRDSDGLYIEGRHLKAAIKEAASVAVAADKVKLKGWGKTNKNLLGFIAEHVVVLEDRLHLGVTEPTGIDQRFVHTWRGSAIQYEEYVEDASVAFTIATDYDFTEHDWAMIWLTGEQQGIGASRSQGYGRYRVTHWERHD